MTESLLAAAALVAVPLVVKVSVVLCVAVVGVSAMSARASAATRHFLLALTVVALLVLPALVVALPEWPVLVRERAASPIAAQPSGGPETSSPAVLSVAAAAPVDRLGTQTAVADAVVTVSWRSIAAAAYLAGVAFLVLRLCGQRWAVRQMGRDATVVGDPAWLALLEESAARLGLRQRVRLLRGAEGRMPLAFGTWRPTILIPAAADDWDTDRRRAVLLHELAHVGRRDCLIQLLAWAACTIYWCHPLVWWVARRMRVERELACDDRVLAAGTPPREYAGHLLEIAYTFGQRPAPALVVSMARPRQLEGRMLAALDITRNRHVPGRHLRIAAGVVASLVVSLVASATFAVVDVRTGVAAVDAQDKTAGAPIAAVPAVVSQSSAVRQTPKAATAATTASEAENQELGGLWKLRPTKIEDRVHLELHEERSTSGTNVSVSGLEGLSPSQLTGSGGPVQFRVRRDAGTLNFEGFIRNGEGAGTFSFTPDAAFAGALTTRGIARPSPREQYQMARHDVGLAFVDELEKQGYPRSTPADLVRAGQHGVHLTYLQEMGGLGYKLGKLDELVTLRDHGVSPSYVRELIALGYTGLSASELRHARDHGITAEYVRGMRAAGHDGLAMGQLVKARDHGVTPAFIAALREAGHSNLSIEKTIRLRDHGVSPEYVREMRDLGYAGDADALVRARDHGVSPAFVRGLTQLGYTDLPLDTVIRLRDHGVTAERVRKANDRAGTRLPVDMLISLSSRGGM